MRNTNALEHQARAYCATAIGIASASSATDILSISPDSTKTSTRTVKVRRITVSGISTTSAPVVVVLAKYSTAISGSGTTLTAVPLDSSFPAASATVKSYTSNPTTGTLTGNIYSAYVQTGSATVTGNIVDIDLDSCLGMITLRGTEYLSVNLNGVTVTGGAFTVVVEWFEDR